MNEKSSVSYKSGKGGRRQPRCELSERNVSVSEKKSEKRNELFARSAHASRKRMNANVPVSNWKTGENRQMRKLNSRNYDLKNCSARGSGGLKSRRLSSPVLRTN